MWRMKLLSWLGMVLVLVTLAGCAASATNGPAPPAAAPTIVMSGPAAPRAAAPTSAPAAAAPGYAPPVVGAPNTDKAGAAPAQAPAANVPAAAPTPAPNGGGILAQPQLNRDVIKTAQLQLGVADVDATLNRIVVMTSELRGFILDQRTAESGTKRTAVVVLRVPVDRFEEALKRLAEMPNVNIDSQQVGGQDVTDQLIDMESRRRNLEATQTRIRSFLDQTKTVDEALKVNQQLADVERQIEELRGRMELTKDRAAYSTLNLDLRLIAPTPTITPTPTLTPTPTPSGAWHPGDTYNDASKVTVWLFRTLADMTIWLAVVGLPLAIPLLIIAGLAWLWRRGQRPATPPPPQNAPGQGD